MSFSVIQYPRIIEGVPFEDSFFFEQKELMNYPFILRLEKKYGLEVVSDFMWIMWTMYDPRSFMSERKSQEKKQEFIMEKYSHIDFPWEDIEIYKEFYLNQVLRNDDIITYMILRDEYQSSLTDRASNGSLNIKEKIEEKRALDLFKHKCYSFLNTEYQDILLQGDKQYGRLHRRRNKIAFEKDK